MEALPLVTFYIGPRPLPNLLPPAGAIGATLGTATNNLYSSPKQGLYALHLLYCSTLTGSGEEV